MTKKKRVLPADTMPLRDFLRGGYQKIDQPTQIMYHSTVLGTFVPGTLEPAADWQPSPLSVQQSSMSANLAQAGAAPRLAYRQLRSIEKTSDIPGWLAGPATPTNPTGTRSRR